MIDNNKKVIYSRYCTRCDKHYALDVQKCEVCGNTLLDGRTDFNTRARAYFIKITDQIVIDDLRRGRIWLRPPKYYQNNSNEAIGDKADCATEITETDKKFDPNIKKKTVFCLYMLTTDEHGNYVISEENKDKLRNFGNKFSIIPANKRNKLYKELKKQYQQIEYKNVKYYSENFIGKINPFFKNERYSYQNEYRFIIEDSRFLSLYNEDDSLKEDKSIYRNNHYLKDVFSRSIDLNLLLDNTNVEKWENQVTF